MSKFRSSLFGGYKKADVNAEISELNKKMEEIEAENKRLMREAENAESRAADLENKLSLLTAGANSEKPEKEVVKKVVVSDDRTGNSELFGNIAKIYERAYGVSHDIVCDSKEKALEMLNALSNQFDKARGESAAVIDKYEEINREVQSMYASLSKNISDVSETTAHMLKKAKEFYEIYDELKDGIEAAKENTDDLLTEFDNQASEFSVAQTAPQAAEPRNVIVETTAEEAGTEESSEKPNNEFTQFGRKSKISTQDRNELLRKALLKSGGN